VSVSASSQEKLLTVEEFLALPDDGTERYLIRGQLRPREPMTSLRNRKHGRIEATLAKLIGNWRDGQPAPPGEVVSGEAGFRLRTEPGSLVGIDVAYASAELASRTPEEAPYYDGPPVLAIEILSPSDKHGEIVEKVQAYLEAGVVVWEINPDFRTVRLHRRGQPPVELNVHQDLVGDPYLPGFRVPVAKIFER